MVAGAAGAEAAHRHAHGSGRSRTCRPRWRGAWAGWWGSRPALTFTGLVRARSWAGPARLVGEFERTLLVAEALRSVPLEALGPVAHLPGVGSAADRLLQELGESGRPAAEVRRAPGTLGGCGAGRRPPLARDVQRLLTAYQAALRASGAHRPGHGGAGGHWPRPKGGGRPVAFCGFTSFTRGQRALVQRLSRETEVLVTLNHERERGVGLCAPGEAEWWIEHALTRSWTSARARGRTRRAAIAHLERFLLSGEAALVGPSGAEGGRGGAVSALLGSPGRGDVGGGAGGAAHQGGLRPWRHRRGRAGRCGRGGGCWATCSPRAASPIRRTPAERLGETGLGYAFLQAAQGRGHG